MTNRWNGLTWHEWHPEIGKSFLFFNWQLVKRLHHLHHLQLLVQVLKLPLCLLSCGIIRPRLRKGVGTQKNLWQESPVTKSTNVTGHLSTACQVNSDLIRFRCARLKIATTFRVSQVFSKSVMKSFGSTTTYIKTKLFISDLGIFDDDWLASSDLLLRKRKGLLYPFMRFYAAMPQTCC